MRNMAVRNSPAFSYPLPVLVRVLSNLLIVNKTYLITTNIAKGYPYKIKLREIYRTDNNIYNLCIKDIEKSP